MTRTTLSALSAYPDTNSIHSQSSVYPDTGQGVRPPLSCPVPDRRPGQPGHLSGFPEIRGHLAGGASPRPAPVGEAGLRRMLSRLRQVYTRATWRPWSGPRRASTGPSQIRRNKSRAYRPRLTRAPSNEQRTTRNANPNPRFLSVGMPFSAAVLGGFYSFTREVNDEIPVSPLR